MDWFWKLLKNYGKEWDKWILTKIKGPSFLKELTEKELNDLAKDIRQFIIESVSQTGGHLSSNLGIVELTIALHYVFNFTWR